MCKAWKPVFHLTEVHEEEEEMMAIDEVGADDDTKVGRTVLCPHSIRVNSEVAFDRCSSGEFCDKGDCGCKSCVDGYADSGRDRRDGCGRVQHVDGRRRLAPQR